MGLLLKLVTLPVSAPVGGTLWIAEQLLAAAEQELGDEAAIKRQLAELDESYAAGELSEDDYEEAADDLLARLLALRDRTWVLAEGGDDEEAP